MSDTQNPDKTTLPADGSTDGRVDEPLIGESQDELQTFLLAFMREAERENSIRVHDKAAGPSSGSRVPLEKLAPGPWRSLGGYLDYSHWQDRERFPELDRAIACAQQLPGIEDESEEWLLPAA